jgi:hypothetical protein
MYGIIHLEHWGWIWCHFIIAMLLLAGEGVCKVHWCIYTKVGKVPTFRASDTDTDLPIVSTDLFSEFQYLQNRFIASK